MGYALIALFSLFTGMLPLEAEGERFGKLKDQADAAIKHICGPVVTIASANSRTAPIPRRLFQTWKTHELPSQFAEWSLTWSRYNPAWEFELWDDAENRAFIQKYYPWFLPRYDSYPKEIYRADAVRYFYLYHFGGIYADLDFECCKSLEPLLNENCVILGRMSPFDHDHNIPNAFMASPPKADFWLVVIRVMLQASSGLRPEYTTGPVVLREALFAYQDKKKRQMILDEMKIFIQAAEPIPVQIRPPCELYPYDWLTLKYEKLSCSYAVTWWAHSWE